MASGMRILILDSTREPSSFGSANLFRSVLAAAPAGSEVRVRRAPDRDWPGREHPDHDPVDALVLSGSVTSCLAPHEPWLRDYDAYLIERIRRKRPILGVCFGHQALARCLFSMQGLEPALTRSPLPEVGWQKQRIVADSPLFQGLDREFHCYQSHYEEVAELPPGVRLTAESDRCRIQAFEMTDAPIFGIQFHPEHDLDHGEAALRAKMDRGENGDWILNPGRGKLLYDPDVGKVIFGNFLRVAQHR